MNVRNVKVRRLQHTPLLYIFDMHCKKYRAERIRLAQNMGTTGRE